MALFQQQAASLRASSESMLEKRKWLWQKWVRQMLNAVLRLGEPRCLEAFMQEPFLNIAKGLTMLANRAGSMEALNVVRVKWAKFYQLCTDGADQIWPDFGQSWPTQAETIYVWLGGVVVCHARAKERCRLPRCGPLVSVGLGVSERC